MSPPVQMCIRDRANYKPPAEDVDTWAAWNRYGIGDYLILERGGVNYGIFGLMGEEADSNAPMSGMEFEPAAEMCIRDREEGVPPEENALRARRLSFYERSGFRRLDYQTRIFGVQYAMLVWPEEDAAEPERLQDAHRGLYRGQLPNPLFRRVIHIPADEH